MLLVLAIAMTAGASPKRETTGQLSTTEEWVITQLKLGTVADLSEAPDRKLSGHFIEKLLNSTLSQREEGQPIHIIGAIIDGQINLLKARIRNEILLTYCTFEDAVIFHAVDSSHSLSFNGSTFKGDADFAAMTVRVGLSFDKATFNKSFDCLGTDVGDLTAKEAHFQNKANFNRVKVRYILTLEKALFDSAVDFGGADIGLELLAEGTQFRDKQSIALFWGINVADQAKFDDAIFEGPVQFTGATFGGQLNCSKTQFLSSVEAKLDDLRIGRDLVIEGAVFAGPANFRYTRIDGSFSARGVKFAMATDCSLMKVGSLVSFYSSTFLGDVDLGFSDFAFLELSDVSWPKADREIRLSGMTYKYVRADAASEARSHEALLRLAQAALFSSDVYTNLERIFMQQGYHTDADWVFISGRRRERDQLQLWDPELWGNLALDWLVGYGRHPWRIGVPCIFFVFLGCLVFSPKRMTSSHSDHKKASIPISAYNRFWYSFGLFLPFVDLKFERFWRPQDDRRFLRHYLRIHILAGWILIPILLAALSGLIK